MSARRVERDRATGDWVVREAPDGLTYGTTSQPGRRVRVLCPRDAERSTAATVAVGMGLITREECDEEDNGRR